MYLFKTVFVAALFLCFAGGLSAQTVGDLKFWTEEFPPYNYTENGVLKGASVDLLAQILKKLGAQTTVSSVQVLPWARAYLLLPKTPNAVLFTMTETPQRAGLFLWVGPISTSRNVLIALKSRHLVVKGPIGSQRLVFGAVRDDAGGQLLHADGVPRGQIELTSRADQSLKMLRAGHIDAFAFDEHVAHWWIRKLGLKVSDFETVRVLATAEHYFAFNKSTQASVVAQFQRALNQIKADGEYQTILERDLR